MTKDDLPPLPEPEYGNDSSYDSNGNFGSFPMYSTADMQAYARQAQRMALEELERRLGPALEWDVSGTCAGAYRDQAAQAILCLRRLANELDAKP